VAKAREAGLASLVAALEHGELDRDELDQAFELAYARWWIDRVVTDDPTADSHGRRNTGVEGWCDGGSAALGSSFTGKVEVSGAASCGSAGASASVLGVHRRGSVE
jgi:hypothetical protein